MLAKSELRLKKLVARLTISFALAREANRVKHLGHPPSPLPDRLTKFLPDGRMAATSGPAAFGRICPGVWPRIAPGRRDQEARKVELPAVRVVGDRVGRQAAVRRPNDRAVTIWDEVDLHSARARRDRVTLALPAPGEHDSPVGNHLGELTARDVLSVDGDSKDPARTRVESGLDPLPAGHPGRVGEEWEHGLRTGRDPHLALDDISLRRGHARRSSSPRARQRLS